MLFEVFLHTFQELRRSLLLWSVGLLIYSLLAALLYLVQPSSEIVNAFGLLVGVEDATMSSEAWLRAVGFSLFLPLILCSLTVWAGSRLISVDEHNGALEMLLSYPLSRWRLVFEKFTALAAGVFLLVAVLWAGLILASAVFTLNFDQSFLAAACLGLALLSLVYGGLAFWISSVTGRAGYARLLTWSILLLTYLLGAVWLHGINMLQWLSPFYHASPSSSTGLPWLHVLVLLALIGMSINAAYRGFEQRDLAV